MAIYCLTTVDKWASSKAQGVYIDASFDKEGFIHCSYAHQLVGVANKHFRGIKNLLILCINRNRLTAKVVDEDLSNQNELYPHIYGPINLNAVINTIPFSCSENGIFDLPKEIIYDDALKK